MQKLSLSVLTISVAALGSAQIPDVFSAFDAGSRSGAAFNVTGSDTFSVFNNPAGLGYTSARTVGLTYRNFPGSNTTLSGNFATPGTFTSGDRGSNGVSHFGYIMPAANLRKGLPGGIGISYQVGGYVNANRSGNNLSSPPFTIQQFQENLTSQADFFTVSYGRPIGDGSSSFGIGITYLSNRVSNTVSGFLVDQQNNATPYPSTNTRETGTGVGIVLGYQVTPKNAPDTSYGVSLRTPIKLSNNDATSGFVETFPGQCSIGVAKRRDGLRGGNDFIVYGAQVNHFFGGKTGILLDRSNQTTVNLGAEYTYANDSALIPIRLGYAVIPGNGNNMIDRSMLNFGLSWRPIGQSYSIDLNYGFPRTGGTDLALGFTYRFDK